MDWADLYIQPSIQEGFCNAVLEAQAMGLLCVVTNAEGLAENVLNKKTGWVVNKRNSEMIANTISSILKSEDSVLDEIRERSISRISSDFNLDLQREKWKYFYQDS